MVRQDRAGTWRDDAAGARDFLHREFKPGLNNFLKYKPVLATIKL